MKVLKKISLIILIAAYLIAGFNHFHNPPSYWRMIPAYIPYPHTVNVLAGLFEMLFALMLIFKRARQLASWGIILMLIAFVPVHIDMVIRAPFVLGSSIVVTPLIAWIRLIVFQPLLMVWAWWYTKTTE